MLHLFCFMFQVGDKLLAVNGHSLVKADHYTAVEVLRSAGQTLTFDIIREVPVMQTPSKVLISSRFFPIKKGVLI